ncbi:NAD(P)-binding domain-containing protein [Polyangium sorediatum]|uniref:NAD(P)-binding domain-containing protein n=1 Tax=Polyangium sorediatum TaxID=889274 RepID=A0ABT6NQK5_9BACT|nr:NAD(P)-binding domain-containing protein [Polyangium sorediatum]MDI1430617.1 NAD(P)-binding domain-containing protein [Polyangium sorediatum]
MADRDRRDEPSAGKPPAALPTLYASPLGDARDRAAVPRELARGRAAKRAEKTSDVTRFRGVLTATVVAAAAAGLSAFLVPPPGGHASPGPLSRPHARAESVTCASCHGTAAAEKRPDEACANCHGAHAPRRRPHERLFKSGAMRCSTCHPIHQADQGVAFVPGEPPIRFAPGVERVLDDAPPAHIQATVPIVTAASCKGCHDPRSPRDPISRCFAPGTEKLGPDKPSLCFDEHFYGGGLRSDRDAVLPLPPTPPARSGGGPRSGGVCAAQHGEDRHVAWDAARDVALAVPKLDRPATSALAWLWLGTGTLAFALTLGLVRGSGALRARRRKAQDKPQAAEALLKPQTRVRLPQIDTQTCLGCYACVDACPYDVLEVQKYVAVVVRPEACCGLTLCEQRCPNGSLRITDGDTIGDRPRIDDALQSQDTPGLFLAGDVTGLPLIKNAILHGAHAVEKIAAGLAAEGAWTGGGERPKDLVIVGAGPAGISAALRAKELGLSFEVIEQGSVAQSIRSFPRGKLVFDQPLDLPLTGKLWLKESTKEELLSHWMRIIRKEDLPIRQDTRMTAVSREADGKLFRVGTESTLGGSAPRAELPPQTPREGGPPRDILARRVLLAIGQRGTPRRLPIELSPEVEARVHYHLADARSFEGKRILVVGLGDVAMEIAVALARQPGTTVTVLHRGSTFTRGKSRNIDEVKRMHAAGRLSLRFETAIAALDPDAATLRARGRDERVPYDAVFVLIGSIPPWDTLKACGVRVAAEAHLGPDRSPSIFVQGPTAAP